MTIPPGDLRHRKRALDPPTPFAARYADIQAVEGHYQRTRPEDRIALHQERRFLRLLTRAERDALQRRFPRELEHDGMAAEVNTSTAAAWDFRARELAVCMLHFGDLMLERRLDLTSDAGATTPTAILALTASGSILELGPPAIDGGRRFVYHPGLRMQRKPREGRTQLAGGVVLGRRVDLGGLVTSHIVLIAVGASAFEGTAPKYGGTALFTPGKDSAPARESTDEIRLDMTTFHVLVDALEHARWGTAERDRLAPQVIALAQSLQERISHGGGVALAEVSSFSTSTGTVYEVHRKGLRGHTHLTRRPQGRTHGEPLADATIGAQTIVVDAPLVLMNRASGAIIACIHAVSEVTE